MVWACRFTNFIVAIVNAIARCWFLLLIGPERLVRTAVRPAWRRSSLSLRPVAELRIRFPRRVRGIRGIAGVAVRCEFSLLKAKLLKPFLDARDHFLRTNVQEAMGLRKAAVVKARLVGAGFAFGPSRLGMVGEKPLRSLWPEDGVGGFAQCRSDVSRARIVPDKDGALFNEFDQFFRVAWNGDLIAE